MSKGRKPSRKRVIVNKKGKKRASSVSKSKKTSSSRKKKGENRYNSIKSAISGHYKSVVGRKVKKNELRIIYTYIRDKYSKEPLKYVLMNIDTIVDLFWEEYCNLYPIELSNFEPAFEWYNIKTVFDYEKQFHLPSDIIEIDMTDIDSGVMVFYAEEYAGKSDEFYEECKLKGLKRESPPPMLILRKAYCDSARRGNVYQYYLTTDEDSPRAFPTEPTRDKRTSPAETPVLEDLKRGNVDSRGNTTDSNKASESSQNDLEIEKLRLQSQERIKKQKLEELSKLLKDGVISFDDYLKGVKEV